MGRARPALNHVDGLASRESGAGEAAWLVRPPTSSRLDNLLGLRREWWTEGVIACWRKTVRVRALQCITRIYPCSLRGARTRVAR